MIHLGRSGWIWTAAVSVVVAFLWSASAKAELRDYRNPVAADYGRALDGECVADLVLSGNSKTVIRYTIGCAGWDAPVLTAVTPGAGQELTRISRRISPQGPGALGPARCGLNGDEMVCRARRTGSVTFEGWLTVEPGTRCQDRFDVSVGSESHRLFPKGCPGAKRLPLPSVAEIEQFRYEHGLDLDLSGDGSAIEARAVALRESLRQGHPAALVARRIWGVPLRDVDLRELEYRLYYNIGGSALLREWIAQNASETYAGSWIDEIAGGQIYVRFTGDQEAQLAALRSAPGILAPERIVGYGVPAFHSMVELEALRDLIAEEGWGPLGLRGLMTRVGVDVKENKVVVGACDPEAVASVLLARFGAEAPFTVAYRRPLVPKRTDESRALLLRCPA